MDDLISRQAVTDTVRKIILGFFSEDGAMNDTEKTLLSVSKAVCNGVRALPSAQPELIEQGAYVRGFEQGRTQGMIDNTIKAEWTNADALDLQPTCNQLATDYISRQAAIDEAYSIVIDGEKYDVVQVETLMGLPSAQQDCTECAEYDHERHYCQKYCDVIRRTLKEFERQEGEG